MSKKSRQYHRRSSAGLALLWNPLSSETTARTEHHWMNINEGHTDMFSVNALKDLHIQEDYSEDNELEEADTC